MGQEQQSLNREASINPWGIEGDEAMDALVDALWADPGDIFGSQPNPRGAGHVWGPDYTRRFLQSTNLKLIIRSHQVPLDETLDKQGMLCFRERVIVAGFSQQNSPYAVYCCCNEAFAKPQDIFKARAEKRNGSLPYTPLIPSEQREMFVQCKAWSWALRSGVFLHHGHESKVITVFSASNHRQNTAGAVFWEQCFLAWSIDLSCFLQLLPKLNKVGMQNAVYMLAYLAQCHTRYPLQLLLQNQ